MKWNAIRTQLEKLIADKDSAFGKYNFGEALSILVRERFISRASKSKVNDAVILKGGLLLTAVYAPQVRFTQDADITIRHAKTLDDLRKIVDEIVKVDLNDGFKFSRDQGKWLSNDDREYDGARFKIGSSFGDTQTQRFTLDVGIGDAVNPIKGSLPTLTEFEVSSFDINIYPAETIAAEKLHACVHRQDDSSRMKDYFDLYILRDKIDQKKFEKAAQATFAQRKLDYPGSLPELEVARMQPLWDQFLKSKRYRVIEKVAPDLKEVMKAIREFYGTSEPKRK